jgi:hypothetical protein
MKRKLTLLRFMLIVIAVTGLPCSSSFSIRLLHTGLLQYTAQDSNL